MRFLAVVLGAALGAAVFLAGGAPAARADAPGGGKAAPPVAVVAADAGGADAAQPGTDAEAREYGQREAQSPEVQEFVGGHVGVIGLLVFVALVLLIVYLAKEI